MAQSAEERAAAWIKEQQDFPRPGGVGEIAPGKTPATFEAQEILSPVVEFVDAALLTFNPLNDFPPLPRNELDDLKNDIATHGIRDPLIVKRNNELLTGANRLLVTRELITEGRDDLNKVPCRYVNRDIDEDEEYEMIEGDNLLRRHLTPTERKRRIVNRIKRLYPERLTQENRGGNPKINSQFLPQTNLADEVSQMTGVPKGTAQHYIRDARQELRQEAKSAISTVKKSPVALSDEQRQAIKGLMHKARSLRARIEQSDQAIKQTEATLADQKQARRAIAREYKKIKKDFDLLIVDLRK